ncbi:hypothetical protein [Bradyrhizobium sp. SZCCHNR3003]|uniref:hypothetical protein n=1 Tax=Bradyrhizobium sp. SZCCHNR3003 TaxID=3057387 RepID=UPI0029168142|nr:hypothetical protein [Bradyrhizobium sp. SZCCHNR3003]
MAPKPPKRRTQRAVRRFKSGGRVPDEPLVGFGREEPEGPAAAVKAPAASDSTDAIRAAIEGQRRAERLQAETMRSAPQQPEPAPQMMTLEEQVAAQPWSDRRKRFVLEHRDILLAPQNAEAIQDYMRMAKRRGITDEEEFDRFVVNGVRIEQCARDHGPEEPSAAAAPVAAPQAQREAFPPPSMPAAANPVGSTEFREPELPAIPSPRRSMPMTAPVQRDVPSYGGKRTSDGSRTLSAEERQIARESIPDRPDMPKLSNHEKELLYLRNRERYKQMVASGEYTSERQR